MPRSVQPAHRTRRPPMGPLRRTMRETGLALITAGVVVFLFVAYQLWGTGLAEAHSQDQLRHSFAATAAAGARQPTGTPSSTGTSSPGGAPATTAVAPTTPTTAAPARPNGDAVAHLVIPTIGVDKYVVEGVGVGDLRRGPGHYPGTPEPGQPGNAAIAGHRTTYGAPFYRLDELKAGDEIQVTTRDGQFRYRVARSEVVKPSEISVLDPTPGNQLTLTTCNPRYSAATRLVVVSTLIDPPAPPAPPVTAVGPASTPAPAPVAKPSLGGGDSGAWPDTLAWGLFALGAWAAVRVGGAKAPRRGWLIVAGGAVACLVPLWFTFVNVVRLLPPNI